MKPTGTPARRRARARALAALTTSLLLTSGCLGWGQSGYNAGKTSYNPSEKALTADTVAGLQLLWSHAGAIVGVVSSGGLTHAVRHATFQVEATTWDTATGGQVWAQRIERYAAGGTHLAVIDRTLAVTMGAQQEAGGHNVPPPYLFSSGFDVRTGAPTPHPFVAGLYPSYDHPRGEASFGTHTALVPMGNQVRIAYDDARPDRVLPDSSLTPLLDESAGVAYSGSWLPTGEQVDAWNLSCTSTGCQPRWSHPGSATRAVLDDSTGTLYLAGTGLEALDKTTGAVKWMAPVGSDVRPAVRGQTVFVVGDDRLTAVPACGASTCAPAWSAAVPAARVPRDIRLAVAGDVVYVAVTTVENQTATTLLSAFDAEGCGASECGPLATLAAPGTHSALLVAGGRVVVGTDVGAYAFGLPH
jgi:hypothetical protein